MRDGEGLRGARRGWQRVVAGERGQGVIPVDGGVGEDGGGMAGGWRGMAGGWRLEGNRRWLGGSRRRLEGN